MASATSNIPDFPTSTDTAFVICDVQQRFESVIHGFNGIVSTAEFLLDVASLLKIPVKITEQVPDKLGSTVDTLKSKYQVSGSPVETTSKTQFAVPLTLVQDNKNVKNIVLVGLETHVCILQTALLYARNGYNVYIPEEGVSSIRTFDRKIALNRLQTTPNVFVTTAESLVFEILGDAKHEHFRDVSKLVKKRASTIAENPLVEG